MNKNIFFTKKLGYPIVNVEIGKGIFSFSKL